MYPQAIRSPGSPPLSPTSTSFPLEWRPRALTRSEYHQERDIVRHGYTGIRLPYPTMHSILTDDQGLPFGEITEVCGESGTGKTTICTQIAFECLLMHPDYEVLFIDTLASFKVSRMTQLIPEEYVRNPYLYQSLLKRFHYICLPELDSLGVYIEEHLHEYLKRAPFRIALVVIDCVSYPFKALPKSVPFDLVTRLTKHLGCTLANLALLHHFAVLTTNTVSTRYDDYEVKSDGYLVASLGKPWDKFVDHRILMFESEALEGGDSLYMATIWKSPRFTCAKQPEGSRCLIPYTLSPQGLDPRPPHHPAPQPLKRPKLS